MKDMAHIVANKNVFDRKSSECLKGKKAATQQKHAVKQGGLSILSVELQKQGATVLSSVLFSAPKS